jgi:cytochrome c553
MRCSWAFVLVILCWSWAGNFSHAAGSEPAPSAASGSLLQQALAGPLRLAEEVVFCTRARYDDPHWYANIGYFCDDEAKKAWPGNGQPDLSKLLRLNLRTGALAILLDPQGGTVRDPCVHYDGQRILFSYRPANSDFFHLYEINADGSALRQITSGDFDDYEPVYLPDGEIAFVSTRCKRWVNCWMTQVGIIYRCAATGRNIRQVSANTEHDNTPWVLPDGRLLYMRWEYVDRSQVEFHHLWTMNPDGTGQSIFYGNMRPHIVMLDAKPLPAGTKVVASFSPGHGVNEHDGIATVVSAEKGPDDPSVPRALHRGRLTRDPYPLSEDCFLAARGNQLVLLDGHGREEVLYTHPGPGGVHEPRPLLARPRERIIPQRVNWRQATGRLVLADVYRGRNLVGVKHGDIKKLLVLESLPKPVNFSGGPDLVSWLGTFTLERVLGTVPVEEDGSAYFEAPAHRQLFFVALDDRDLSVKRMQSWCSVAPGEVVGCVGCHERRTETAAAKGDAPLMALRRPPSLLQPFDGFPDVLDFTRDVQPVLDRLCVPCHTYEKRDGKALLAGDLGPEWSHSYFSLFALRQVADGRNGLGNQPPRSVGSSASALLQKVDGSHYGAKATAREWRTLWLWIESGAPYAGTYAALRNQRQQNAAGSASATVFGRVHEVLNRRCVSCHQAGGQPDSPGMPLPFTQELARNSRQASPRPTAVYERVVFENDPIARTSPNILVNFSRPEFSPLLLGPLAKAAGGWGSCGDVFVGKDDADYQRVLAAIKEGKSILEAEPRFSTPGFKPNRQYVREMKRFGILPASFDPAKDTLDVFQVDQEYWKSLWHEPTQDSARQAAAR